MKKLCSLLLAVMLVVSALPTLAAINYEGDPRIVPEGEDVTLTIFQPLTPTVENLGRDKNKATKLMEGATGLKLNFVTALESDAEQKLNLLLNSGDYPYIISWETGLTKAEMDNYAKEGIFIPLDEYISPEKTPNTVEMFAYSDAIRSYVTGSDGKIYSLPGFNECFHCLYGEGRAWYNMPFMTAYEKGMPQTTQELKDYLTWIRDEDVNGNGDKNDENPWCSTPRIRTASCAGSATSTRSTPLRTTAWKRKATARSWPASPRPNTRWPCSSPMICTRKA